MHGQDLAACIRGKRAEMITRAVVHVGLHKTGTTSLQRAFRSSKNNATLRDAGILYPTSWPENHSIPVYSMFSDNPEDYHINVGAGRDLDTTQALNVRYRSDLISELLMADCSELLISGEDISVLSKAGLHSFRQFLHPICGDNVDIVAYVRHPVEWAISQMQEAIKTRATYSEAFRHALTAVQTLPNRLHALLDVFGSTRVRVFRFEDAVSDPEGYLRHFLKSVGHATLPELTPVKANESLSDLAASVIAYCHERRATCGDWLPNNDPEWIRDRELLSALPGPKFDVSVEERAALLEAATPTIDYLDSTFGIHYSAADTARRPTPARPDPGIGPLLDIRTRLSPTAQSLVVDYLATREHRQVQAELIPHVQRRMRSIKEEPGRLAAEQLLRTQLGVRNTLPRAEFYRDIGSFLESNGHLEAAHSMMQVASSLRPHGPYIRDKLAAYQGELMQRRWLGRRSLICLGERIKRFTAIGWHWVRLAWSSRRQTQSRPDR